MKSTILTRIFIALVIAFVLLQLVHTAKNISEISTTNSIEQHYDVPKNVSILLKTSCYDCHSNNTVYPWYNDIQPVAWWLNSHVKDGKKHLNFDEFDAYPLEKKKKKLSEIVKTIEKGEMPLKSYTFIHANAKLSIAQQKEITDWATLLKENITR